MHARSLRPLLQGAVAAAIPLAAVCAVTPMLPGCCPPVVRREIRTISAIPTGWTRVSDHFESRDHDAYYGGADDPGIDKEACATLCGMAAKDCEIVLSCVPPAGDGGVDAGQGSSDICNQEPVAHPYELLVLCEFANGAICGRRPAGLARRAQRRAAPATPLGAYFAALAHLEAASVAAFAVLGRELCAHGAPRSLRRAAARAARDEERHARAMAALARQFGGRTAAPKIEAPAAPRPLLQVAIENEREGCVRETHGAATALWQAAHAEDARIRAVFRGIAADEIRHAALAWRVGAWARTRLSAQARARLDAAFAHARAELARELAVDPPEALVRTAGVPRARAAQRMADAVAETVARYG